MLLIWCLSRTRLVEYISSALGEGYSKTTIVSSLALAIMILFYPLYVGSYFYPDVYRFEDRTTYHQYFKDNYIFSWLIDSTMIIFAFIGWLWSSIKKVTIKLAASMTACIF